MLDDLFFSDNLRGVQDLASRPPPVPKTVPSQFSAWKLTTAAPRGVAAGAAQSGGFMSDIVGAFGQALDATGTAGAGGMFAGQTATEAQSSDQAAQQIRSSGLEFSSEAGDLFRGVARGYSPDPATAHASERLVFDFARVASKAVGYTIAGGPVVGPALTAGDEGMAVADDLKQQGVDLATRTKVGAVIGAVTGLGVGLPMAGKTLAQTAGLVAAGGPLSFMGQQAAVREILAGADYSKLAEQYDPFDPVGLAVSTLIPVGFGAWGLRSARALAAAQAAEDFRTGPVPSAETPTAAAAREGTGRASEEQVDAARTMLAVEQRQASSPFRPDDWRAYDVHEAALARAIDQIATGQAVRVNDAMVSPELAAARQQLDAIDTLQAEREALLPQAANLAEPGTIREVRAELRLMEQQRPDTSEAAVRELAKSIQQQGGSYKAALAEAKKQTSAALQDFEARQQRLQQTIETNAQGQRATQQLGELDQRITELEQQLGPEAKLARFERTLTRDLRALAAESAPARPTQGPTDATAAPARPAAEAPAAKPQAADAPGAGRAAEPAAQPGQGVGDAAAPGRLVDDGAATRVAQIEAEMPDLMVMLDGMDKPARLSDVLAAVKAEADELKLDGDLMRAAAECALLNGP